MLAGKIMDRLGRWMLDHPWTLGWLALMVMLDLALILGGVNTVEDLGVPW